MGKISEIKTGIDRFLDLINASGEIKVEFAAVKLGVPVETIEIWAEILAQDNVVEIGYDGFGKMTVRPITAPKAVLAKFKAPVIKEIPEPKQPILRKIKEKSAWKKRLGNKPRNAYSKRLKAPEAAADIGPAESAFSRLLKKFGLKK